MVLMTFYAYVIKLLFIVLFGVLRFLSVLRKNIFLDHVVLSGQKTVMEFIAVTISYNYCYFWGQYKYLASPKIHRAQLLKKYTAKGHSDIKVHC